MRWIGIDEAGYGPNLGPLVMTAVAAQGPGDRPPDLWADLSHAVCRAGGPSDRLWVDDSKRLYRGGSGLDRLEAAAMAALEAAGIAEPDTFPGLLLALGIDPKADGELEPWLPEGSAAAAPIASSLARVDAARHLRAFEGGPWRIVALRSVLVGPNRFNAGLDAAGSKAVVHFDAFARLLRWAWEASATSGTALLRGDKHGGRHFYAGPLARAVPGAWIDRGSEGPDLSRYTLRDDDRRLDVEFAPRADANDGLVALAGIVSKVVREHWMAAFNAYWAARVPGLRPSAGYPVDAARFRDQILAQIPDPDPPLQRWWRRK